MTVNPFNNNTPHSDQKLNYLAGTPVYASNRAKSVQIVGGRTLKLFMCWYKIACVYRQVYFPLTAGVAYIRVFIFY